MAINTTLRVTPEELKSQKGILDQDITNMRNDITNLTNEILGTDAYWLGEAGNKQRNDFREGLQKINDMITRLDTYPVRVLVMAGIYEESEEVNKQTASSLKADVELI